MIGTNDTNSNVDLTNAPRRLANLLDQILDADPHLLLVVAQILPQGSDANNARVQPYNAAIPVLVNARADAGKHIVMVDMYSAFTAKADYRVSYLTDTLHPNATGYKVMADVWYAAVR